MSVMKNLGVGIILIGLVGGGVAYWYYQQSQKPFLYAGTLETTKVILSSKVNSDIVSLPVIEGDTVKKGQLVVEMSCDTYKVSSPQVDNDYARAQALIQKGHLSQAEFDMLERNKRDNDLKLAWCRVISPLDGIVITKFREEGEVVGVGTTLLSIANPYEIWAYFYVPHDEVYRLKIGQEVIGSLPEAPEKRFKGQIIKISEEAEFTPKNVQTREERTRLVYGIKVQFENPDLVLKSGMTIESDLLHE